MGGNERAEEDCAGGVGESRSEVAKWDSWDDKCILRGDDGNWKSKTFNNRGNAHAAADAQGREAKAQFSAFQLVDQGAEEHRASGAERVAHGDRAAVDVDDLLRYVHFLHELHRHHGEGFVDFEQVY